LLLLEAFSKIFTDGSLSVDDRRHCGIYRKMWDRKKEGEIELALDRNKSTQNKASIKTDYYESEGKTTSISSRSM
jgi:hypothetical protein